MNLGLGRPRRRHNSGSSDPERSLVPSLPTAIRSPSGLRCLRRAGAGTSETGKAAKELAGSRFPIGDTVPLPAIRPPPARPGSRHVLASPPPGLLAQGQRPQSRRRPQLIYLEAQSQPPPELALHSNFLLLGQPECPPGAPANSKSQGRGEPAESGTSKAPPALAGPTVRQPRQLLEWVLGLVSESEFSAFRQ